MLFSLIQAKSKLLHNEGVVDIGVKATTSEIEVPKEYVLSEPIKTTIPNEIVYSNRIQSDRFDCEQDFLGNELCPVEKTVCPATEEFSNGYSTSHHVKQSYVKLCDSNSILDGVKCYFDGNRDSVKDSAAIRDFIDYDVTLGFMIDKESNNFEAVFADANGEKLHTYFSAGGAPAVPATFVDYNVSGGYETLSAYAVTIPRGTSNYYTFWTKAEYEAFYPANWWITESSQNMTIALGAKSNSAGLRNYQYTSVEIGGTRVRSMPFLIYYPVRRQHSCPSGYTLEVSTMQCYKLSRCPDNTLVQPDGSCLMEYDWYSYHCDAVNNVYDKPWQAISNGGDCGSVVCTNSSIPPVNNCVRGTYVCPTDAKTVCAKSTFGQRQCNDGYVYNNNRCERVESFCGVYTYNPVLDICQDIKNYPKYCVSVNDNYDVTRDACVGNTKICEVGTYNALSNVCEMEFKASCLKQGYVYDTISQRCVNATLELCKYNGYTYDPAKGACVGFSTMCDTGYTYSPLINKCLQATCTTLNTTDKNSRCETANICIGTITADGRCIPTVVFN